MQNCSRGGTVAVVVDGQALQEYQVKQHYEGNVQVYTCFIQAKDGKEYVIEVDAFPVKAKGQLRCIAYIDGGQSSTNGMCAPDSMTSKQISFFDCSIDGFYETNKDGKTVIRAFEFAKIETTNDDAAKLSSRSLEDYDTIRVEITQVTRKGKQNHEYVKYDYQCELPENPVVHEDSKPAVYGYKTGFGKELYEVEGEGQICSCVIDEAIPETKTVFLFKYLPDEWLVLKGLKSAAREMEEEDDEGFEIDVQRTERSARLLSLRRAKEQTMEGMEREVCVKTELTNSTTPRVKLNLEQAHTLVDKAPVKIEPEIEIKKEERKAARETEVFDLTDDGDFVFPSRQVGDTIVLADK